MNRKKICFIVSTPLTVKAFLVNHIIALSQNYDVYLIANLDTYDSSFLEKLPLKHVENIKIVRDISIIEDLKALKSLCKYFKKEKFHIVHSVTPKAGLIAMLASSATRIKNRIHIFTGQVWYTQKGLKKSLLKFMDLIIVKNATQILVDGEPQRQFLIKEGILKNENSLVLGKGSISGVDSNKFLSNKAIAQNVRNELNIDDGEVVFMFLGRLNYEKGIVELVDAFEKLAKKYSNVRLLLVGEDEENMKEYILTKKEIIGRTIIYGATKEPYRLLQAADIFCMPSHREGFGLSVLEASLMEKPIIASDTYGLADTIVDGVTGIRYKLKNVESLFNSMENLYLDPIKRQNLGRQGRNYVLKYYTSEMITEEWLKFYKNFLIN